MTTATTDPEPWSVWTNPWNGYLVWHEPTRKWLPVTNNMTEAIDPDHWAAQNLRQLTPPAAHTTDTNTRPDIPTIYAGRYTLKDRHLHCDDCGTPHLPDTAIMVFATPPTQDELLGYLHMHEIAHAGTATFGARLDELTQRLDEISNALNTALETIRDLEARDTP